MEAEPPPGLLIQESSSADSGNYRRAGGGVNEAGSLSVKREREGIEASTLFLALVGVFEEIGGLFWAGVALPLFRSFQSLFFGDVYLGRAGDEAMTKYCMEGR